MASDAYTVYFEGSAVVALDDPTDATEITDAVQSAIGHTGAVVETILDVRKAR